MDDEMLRFILPGDWIPSSFPESAIPMLKIICAHEAGHAVVAQHFGCEMFCIALTQERTGLRPKALYSSDGLSIREKAVVHAAGSAGELAHFGHYGEDGSGDDKAAISGLGCGESYDDLVAEGLAIIRMNAQQFESIRMTCSSRLFDSAQVVRLKMLANNEWGHILIAGDEGD